MDADEAAREAAEIVWLEGTGTDDYALFHELPVQKTGRRYDRHIREKFGLDEPLPMSCFFYPQLPPEGD